MISEKQLTVATINLNGIRAAHKRGLLEWLKTQQIDVLCFQETRAADNIITDLLPSWHLVTDSSLIKGRAGVAIVANAPLANFKQGLELEGDSHTGRWVEADYVSPSGENLTIVSVYVHSGQVDTIKQDNKYVFLDKMLARLQQLRAQRRHVLVAGDFNIAHTELDLKNHKNNTKNAGFLPKERSYLDEILENGWVDVARKLAGNIAGPYTWWSWRGQAFTNDAGWRIDYHFCTPELAASAIRMRVEKGAEYENRFSDHAPLIISYSI